MARYSDFFTSFQAHPDTKQLLVKTDERAITQSIRNLILTNRGERPFENSIGSNVRFMLYEQISESSDDTIKELILETLRQEPRARINDVLVRSNDFNGSVGVVIEYQFAGGAEPAVVQLTLSRVR